MNTTTKRILLVFGFVFLGGVLATLAMPSGFRKLDMMCEGDGFRQKDWKYFGFIPMSATEKDATLHVTDDFKRELAASGLKPDPGFLKGKPDILIRNYYDVVMTYYCRTTVEANYADLGRFYAKQMKTKLVSSGTETFIHGTLPNGQQGEVQLWNHGRSSKPGLDKIEVVIELRFPKVK